MKRHASSEWHHAWGARVKKDSMNSTKISTIEISKNSRRKFTRKTDIPAAGHSHCPE